MADIVFIQPKMSSIRNSVQPPALPLSLLTLAGVLQPGYSVRIIDQRVDPDWRQSLLKELKGSPLFVGLTCLSGEPIKHALEASRLVKENSNSKVVWGGIHPSLLPEQTLQNEFIDIVNIGDGEETIQELAHALDKRLPLLDVKGLAFKNPDASITRTAPRPFPDLNEYLELPYSLVDTESYVQKYAGRRTFYVQTSRGCPYSCAFCTGTAYYRSSWRALTPENSLSRISMLVNDLKAENLWFIDDNFFVDIKRARAITEGLISLNYDLTWDVLGAPLMPLSRLEPSYFDLLYKAGCRKLYIGAESASPRILALINKHISLDALDSFNKRISSTGIVPRYNFVSAFPTETDNDIKDSISLAFKLLKDNPSAEVSSFSAYTPYPATPLFDFSVSNGFVPPSSLEEWSKFDWSKVNLPWISPGKKKELEALYFLMLFIDRKYESELNSPLLRFLARCYSPIARYRVKNMFFSFLFERYCMAFLRR